MQLGAADVSSWVGCFLVGQIGLASRFCEPFRPTPQQRVILLPYWPNRIYAALLLAGASAKQRPRTSIGGLQ
jgi:hypothetical protein